MKTARQQVGRACDGLVGLRHDGVERLGGRRLGLLHLIGTGGDILEHGEDGTLDRLAHGLEGDLHPRAQRSGDVRRRRIGTLCAYEPLGDAPQDLARDDAGVATRPHERPMRDGLGHSGLGCALGKGLNLLHHGAQRE